MKYRTFYYAARLGEIPAESATATELTEICSRILPLLKEDKEFFGVIDANDTTLQAMYDAEADEYWFEVPRPDLRGSYGKTMSFDVALDFMKNLAEDIPLNGFDGFEFQSW